MARGLQICFCPFSFTYNFSTSFHWHFPYMKINTWYVVRSYCQRFAAKQFLPCTAWILICPKLLCLWTVTTKTKSWFYIFVQKFLLSYYTNLDKAETSKKCTHVEVSLLAILKKNHRNSLFFIGFYPFINSFFPFV